MTPSHIVLPYLTDEVQAVLTRFSQMTASQVRRLLYTTGTDKGQRVRSSRQLKRLADLGYVRRVQGVYNGVAEYVYLPEGSKARAANMHTLDIAELYVKLNEHHLLGHVTNSSSEEFVFDPEPWCHVPVGQTTLKPDASMKIGSSAYYIEVDRGTEFRSVLAQKMRRYINAFEYRWKVEHAQGFPLVVWVVHDADRKRFMESVIKSQTEPRLFTVCLFDDFVELIKR